LRALRERERERERKREREREREYCNPVDRTDSGRDVRIIR
jgi:hypothetical protein